MQLNHCIRSLKVGALAEPPVPTSVPSKLQLGTSLIKCVWSSLVDILCCGCKHPVVVRIVRLSKIDCLIKCKINSVVCWRYGWLETESSTCSQTGGKTKRVRISFAVTLISSHTVAWIIIRTVLYTRPAVCIAIASWRTPVIGRVQPLTITPTLTLTPTLTPTPKPN